MRRGSLLAALASALALLPASSAFAESCPGAGSGTCPYSSATIVGGSPGGVLRYPEAVALGPQGDIYVADQLSYAVMRFSPAGIFEAQWGAYGGGPGQFGPIGGLATDASGDVYVVDSSHNRIEKFGPNGEYITSWGTTGTELGQFHFGSSQNPTQPPGGGIAISGNYVFVSDTANDRIERFNLEGGEALQFGSGGSGPGQLSGPRGLAANEGELIVADDDNDRIDKFGLNGEYQATSGSMGSGPGQFQFPYGVALDASGNVYVADDINDRVDKLTSQLTFSAMWGGSGSNPGELSFPRAIASDAAGETYVADTANDRIDVFSPVGVYQRSFGISAGSPNVMSAPRALAVDPTGRLLVSDTFTNRIDLYWPGSSAYAGSWTAASEAEPAPLIPGAPPSSEGAVRGLTSPLGIGVSPNGYIYVEDTAHHLLTRLWGDGTYLSTMGSLTGASALDWSAVAVSSSTGDIYLSDTTNNRILVYNPEGTLLGAWGADGGNGTAGTGPGQFNSPRGIAIDAAGNVYVADYYNDRIEKLSSTGSFIGEWGIKGTRPGRFENPAGVAIDGAGHVYVVDYGNNRVEAFNENGTYLQEWGLRGTALGDFSQPTAIAVGCEGAVYVADTNNNRVERFLPVSPAGPSACLPAGSWPGQLNVAPVLAVTLLHRSGTLIRDGLGLTVSCARGCTVKVTGVLKTTNKPHRTVSLVASSRSLPLIYPGHVRLRLTRSHLSILRKALGAHHKGMVAVVKILATGPTGKQTKLTKTYAVRR